MLWMLVYVLAGGWVVAWAWVGVGSTVSGGSPGGLVARMAGGARIRAHHWVRPHWVGPVGGVLTLESKLMSWEASSCCG